MDSKKKVLIAIIIIILLSLTIFAFAGSDDEEEGLKEGSKTQQVDKKDNKKEESKDSEKEEDSEEEKESEEKKPSSKKEDSKKDKESKKDEEGTGETEESKDETYEKALELVKKAEESLTREDLEAAREAVEAVTQTNTDELEERLDKVESDIDARELVEALEKLVKEAENKDDIDKARGFDKENKVSEVIANVNNEELKKELENKYEELEKILEDTSAPEVTGVEDGGFYNELNVEVKDDTNVTIYVDGEEVELPLDVEELGDGEHKLVVVDEAFNASEEITFTVDTVAPTAEVEYSPKELTNKDVKAKLVNASEEIIITKNDGSAEYVFTADGEFTFEFEDKAGNKGSVTATVDWIDKDAPVIEFTGGSIIKDKYSIEPIVITVRDKKLKSLSYIACEINKKGKENCTKKAVEGFEKVEDGVYQKVINPSDLGKGKQKVYRLKVTAVDSFDKSTNVTSSDYYVNLKTVKVEYSTTEPTKKDVVVTISAPKKQTISTLNDGWTLNKKKDKLTKTFNSNTTEKVVVKCSDGTVLTIDVKVANIDRKDPELVGEVTYSTKELTKDNVTVTVTFDEPVVAPKEWNAVGNTISKEYEANAKETITVKDLAGNTVNFDVEIDNIDKTKPTLKSETRTPESTDPIKEDVVVELEFSESLDENELPTDWELVDGSTTTITRTFRTNTESGYSIKVKDLAGNESDAVAVTVSNIDKKVTGVTVSYNPAEKTVPTQKVVVTISADEDITIDGWKKVDSKTYEKEFDENITDSVTVKDTLGNEKEVSYDTTGYTIDNDKPTLVSETRTPESTDPIKEDVVVELEFSESLDENELPTDWELVDGSTTTITRTFRTNTESGYSIKVKDLAGNESDVVDVTVSNIDKEVTGVTVSYNPAEKTVPTQKVVVTISADEDITIDGWTKVDSKTYEKVFTTNTADSVTVKDALGNEKEVDYDTTGYTIDNDKPNKVGDVKYEKDDQTGKVKVTIEFDEPLKNELPTDWSFVEGSTTKITTTFESNTESGYSIKVKDLAGNESDAVAVTVTNAGKEETKKPDITSATYKIQNKNKATITVTVENSEEYSLLYRVNGGNWSEFKSGSAITSSGTFKNVTKIEVKAIDNDTKLESEVVEAILKK